MSNLLPQNTRRPPTPLLIALTILLPPLTGIVTFSQAVTRNPGITILLICAYELLVFIASVFAKIWQQLEGRWINRVVDWIDTEAQNLLSGYHQYYKEYLYYEHRDFDMRGLSTQNTYTLPLEQVFVELSIDATSPHLTSSDPVHQIHEVLRSGTHPIWEYLSSEQLAGQHLVIIGAPGSGKTTLLKHVVLLLVSKRVQKKYSKIPYRLPIILFLREHADTLKENPDMVLADILQARLSKWDRPVPPQWVKRQLLRGNCLILLDGLDEVADAQSRRQVVAWVQRQIIIYKKNRFLITSRPFGYRSNPVQGVTVLEVQPFTTRQIKQFIHNWYVANEVMSSQRDDPGVRMKAREGADDLLQRLHSTPALLELAVNPLLLTMIATVHRYRNTLPEKRVALYAEICEVFLGKRQEAVGLTQELNAAQKRQVLQPLAYQMMKRKTRDLSLSDACQVIQTSLSFITPDMSPEVFLQLVENLSGLLLEREQGIYSFAHQTFQEYLAATHLKEEKKVEDLLEYIEESWWHETIRLYCAQADATAIITKCLSEDPPSLQALTLALECNQEALKVQPSVRRQLDAFLDAGFGDQDSERRHVITEALLARRLRQMTHLYEKTFIDTSFVTCAEYQLFLDAQRERRGNCHQPDHWMTYTFPVGQGKSPALGVRLTDALAFCDWLTERDPGTWQYRLPNSKSAFTTQEMRSTLAHLPANTGCWINIDEDLGFVWSSQWNTQIQARLEDMIRVLHASDRHQALSLERDRDAEKERGNFLSLARKKDAAQYDAFTRERNQDRCDSVLDRARARDHVNSIDIELAQHLDRIIDLDHFLAGVLYLEKNNNFHRAIELNRASIQDLQGAISRHTASNIFLEECLRSISSLIESMKRYAIRQARSCS